MPMAFGYGKRSKVRYNDMDFQATKQTMLQENYITIVLVIRE